MSRKYYLQCPYCDKRLEREDLVVHIEKKHSDEIPEGFTPLRIVYHVANKRKLDDPRKCRVCSRPCPWDEKKGRYDQLCGRPECKKKQAENMGNNMGDKLRSNSPTQSVDGLEKMLAGRSISKKYTWSDGTTFVYTGSYEGNLLKWIDQVMETKSEDWQIPGPTLHYEYEGEEHIYIPDFYYIPYHLIIEVKDGGDRPNTSAARHDSRMKTIAKEKHIINKTDYNYIRLTNNDFSQLLAVFADLKMNLVENRQSRVIHVNESMAQTGIAPMVGQSDVVLVDYIPNKAFCGKSYLALSTDTNLTNLFGIDRRGRLDRIYKEALIEGKYSAYVVTGVREKVEKFLKENINKEMDSEWIYEAIFDHKRTTHDQILFEERIQPCILFEGLFDKKKQEKLNSVKLSDFKKIRLNKDTARKYGKFSIDDDADNFDGYFIVDNRDELQAMFILKKKGRYNKRDMFQFMPAGIKAGKDAPIWNEIGKLIIKELRAEFISTVITVPKGNDVWLSMKDIEEIHISEVPYRRMLIDNGMKYELWQSRKLDKSVQYLYAFYTGSKPNLKEDP